VNELPEQGVILRDLLQMCVGFDSHQFQALFNFPFLIQQTHAGKSNKATLALSTEDDQAAMETRFSPLDRMVFGVKRNKSRLAEVITIGREGDNDVVLPYRFISKEHGFFSCAGKDWSIVDNNSTNGVFVGKTRLESGRSKMLKNKIEIGISRYLRFQYIAPDQMFKFLRLASTLYG
jgi:hypothetical protein